MTEQGKSKLIRKAGEEILESEFHKNPSALTMTMGRINDIPGQYEREQAWAADHSKEAHM